MVGKLFLFVLISISVAQEIGLEDVIQRGLSRAKSINESGRNQIEATLREVGFKIELIQVKADDFVRRSVKTQNGLRQSLRNIAQATETKARVNNAPESVFECIKRAEENANNRIESFTIRFLTDVRGAQETKLDNIKTGTQTLDEVSNVLQGRYEGAVELIKACQSESCVNSEETSFATFVDRLSAEMKRILGQVSTTYNSFLRDVSILFQNTNRQVSMVNGVASGSIRRCLIATD